MEQSFKKLLQGYQVVRDKYAHGDSSIMHQLSQHGQQPQAMVIACCDSRVDPALLLQCNPGDLFVVRNVANIVPPYENDNGHHGTSAALEFGICYLKVKHLILLGHSQCGGIHALLHSEQLKQNDFISNWVSLIDAKDYDDEHIDNCAKAALHQSHKNCLDFPWIKERIAKNELKIHLWFFDIKTGQIFNYLTPKGDYVPLE